MDDHPDPLHTFFPDVTPSTQPTILYTTLSLSKTSTAEEIRKSYRKLALLSHPDKHASKSQEDRDELSKQFQRIGFAYAVLSDEDKRKRYDKTGRTDERFSDIGDAEGGWEKYFESLFERVDRKVLDEHKKKYQGSEEERSDLIEAYTAHSGSLPSILSSIPHSSTSDEERFVELINSLISSGELEATAKWKKTSKDDKARSQRKKKEEKEGREAEETAKELGVWDEFYGSGKKGKRVNDDVSNGKDKGKGGQGEEGEGALQALILKRQRERESGLNGLEEKYRKIEEEARARKKAKASGSSKSKKGKKPPVDVDDDGEEEGPPDISDADFEALQAKMFGKKK